VPLLAAASLPQCRRGARESWRPLLAFRARQAGRRSADAIASASLRRCYDQMRIKRASPQRDLFRVLIPAHAPYVNSELELSVRTLRGSDGKKAGGLPSGRPWLFVVATLLCAVAFLAPAAAAAPVGRPSQRGWACRCLAMAFCRHVVFTPPRPWQPNLVADRRRLGSHSHTQN
jgi:hypothetical protein